MYRNQGFTKDKDIGQGRLRIPSSIVNVIFSYTGGEIAEAVPQLFFNKQHQK